MANPNKKQDLAPDKTKPPVEETPKSKGTKPSIKKVTLATVKTSDEVKELFLGNSNTQNVMNSFENYVLANSRATTKGNKRTLVSLRFELFNNIKNVIETNDYDKFKQQFDFVNAMFRVNPDEVFSHTSLIMFDYLWEFGADSKLAYQQITKVIETLANPKTRKQQIGKISVEHIFKYVSPTGVKNLTKYYDL